MRYKEYGPYKNKEGYAFIVRKHSDGHVTSTWVHREMMEKHLKRKLTRNEVVHHINEDPSDNRIENFEIKTRRKHTSDHAPAPEMALILCAECGEEAVVRAYQIRHNQTNQGKAGPFCGRSCAGRYGQRLQRTFRGGRKNPAVA